MITNGILSGLCAIGTVTGTTLSVLAQSGEVGNISAIGSAVLGAGALLFLYRHVADADKHINKRDTFVPTTVCKQQHEENRKERERIAAELAQQNKVIEKQFHIIRKAMAYSIAKQWGKEHKISDWNKSKDASMIVDAIVEKLNGDE